MDEDGVWMAAIENPSRFKYVDNEGEHRESVAHHRECVGALLFSDEELVDSPASQIKFLGHKSILTIISRVLTMEKLELTGDEYVSRLEAADVSEDFEDMPALVDVSNPSDYEGAEVFGADIKSNHQNDENNLYGDLPKLEEVSDSSDDEDSYMEDIYDATDDLLNFLDEADEILAVDTLGEAYTKIYGCATLVNAAGINDGVETELYYSGASRQMSPYRSRLENYKRIEENSMTSAAKRSFQAIGVGNLRIQIPNGKNTTTIL